MENFLWMKSKDFPIHERASDTKFLATQCELPHTVYGFERPGNAKMESCHALIHDPDVGVWPRRYRRQALRVWHPGGIGVHGREGGEA